VAVTTRPRPSSELLVLAALLASLLPGGIHSAAAQSAVPTTVVALGTAVEVSDGWQITVTDATLHPLAADAGPATPSLLVASLLVQNLASPARYFPTSRLQLTSDSSSAWRLTLCRGVEASLELSPQIPPQGTAAGALCWRAESGAAGPMLLSWDTGTDARVAFALDPVAGTEVRSAGTAATNASAPGLRRDDAAARRPTSAGASTVVQGTPPAARGVNSTGGEGTRAIGPVGQGGGGGSSAAISQGGAAPCQLYPSGSQPNTTVADDHARPFALQCPRTGTSSSGNAGVATCQLYASASQPNNSSIATGTGVALREATSAAPPCPLVSGGGRGATSDSVPACRLYPSADQPAQSSYGVGNYPLTPVPQPTVAIPPGGRLAGTHC
jgi:hypothetical protein